MIDRFGLEVTEQPLETFPADLETAFIDFGFGECLDAFLGFGAFKTARESEFLPEGMFQIFDVLMHEETRHIVFFTNYEAWREKHRGHIALSRAFEISVALWSCGAATDRHGAPETGRQRRPGLRSNAGQHVSGWVRLPTVRGRLLPGECTPHERIRSRTDAAALASGHRGSRIAALGSRSATLAQNSITPSLSCGVNWTKCQFRVEAVARLTDRRKSASG
jgi:hypothetical protein